MCKTIDTLNKDINKKNYNNPALMRDIPYDKIYEAARKESSRKKPVFFIHKYFARRITSSFRMMLLGALLPYNEDIWNYFYKSFNENNLEEFTVLDPFMGGGTTLFEASRFNMKVIGNDLQPLSKFVSTAILKKINYDSIQESLKTLENTVGKEIMKYQKTKCPECNEEADIMYSFHVKVVKTESKCKEHFLFSNFVLSLKKNIFTLVCPDCGEVFEHNFKENGSAECPACKRKFLTPKEGYVNRGHFHCAKCGEDKKVSEYSLESGYPKRTKLVAIEYYCPHCKTHGYKKIDKDDIELYKKACNYYDEIKNSLPIPNQKIPIGYNTKQIINHGYVYFKDLFNKRQLLELGILLDAINSMDDKESQFWFQLAFSGMLEMNNMFCRYQANAYKITNIFFNHAYVPITMPVENNVWGTKLGTGTFIKTLNKIIRGKKFCNNIYDVKTINKGDNIIVEKKFSNETVECDLASNIDEMECKKPFLNCGDSRNLDFISNETIDMVLTDPPFGANVMYSELIDFFHVWNYNSSIAEELGFIEPLSPKNKEIIVNKTRNLTQKDYCNGLTEVFLECNRVLKDNGLLIFSFHDKSLESWKSVLISVDKAGFNLAKVYPLHAETRTGAHTSNKNSIAFDIMLIYRKRVIKDQKKYNPINGQELNKKALQKTEDTINRLIKINAEITIPDIQNIYISNYISLCSMLNIEVESVFKDGYEFLKNILENIGCCFENIEISNKRTGWWSEVFKDKWNV